MLPLHIMSIRIPSIENKFDSLNYVLMNCPQNHKDLETLHTILIERYNLVVVQKEAFRKCIEYLQGVRDDLSAEAEKLRNENRSVSNYCNYLQADRSKLIERNADLGAENRKLRLKLRKEKKIN